MDDRRVGLVIRALRRRRHWRQRDLGEEAALSESVIGRAERGHFDTLSLRAIRQIMAALDVRPDLDPRWRGGEIDRVLDSRHAAVIGPASDFLVASDWQALQEVTYAFYRERGSIDLLGLRQDIAAAAVMEIKSEVTSREETQRRFDEKVRLLPKIVFERVGWRPRTIGKILVLEDSMSNRRRIAQLGAAVSQAYPARTREVRRWLRTPDGPLAGIWFLGRGGPHRVRRPRDAAD